MEWKRAQGEREIETVTATGRVSIPGFCKKLVKAFMGLGWLRIGLVKPVKQDLVGFYVCVSEPEGIV